MGQTTSNIIRKVASPFRGKTSESSDDAYKMAITPFVFTRRGSLYRDEDGHMAHEFYEEVEDEKSHKHTMRRKYGNLTPQGEVELPIPRLNYDFPVVLCEAFPR